jgi:hypothetical protein
MATPGSSSRSKTGYVAEVTKGTTPATPAIQNMRLTSSQLAYTPTRVTSNEIRPDRMVADQILTKFEGGGNIGFELSFHGQDDMIAGALQGSWGNTPNQAVSALSTTTATVAAGATFKAQMLAFLSGFATPANNNLFVVSSSGSTTVVFPSSSFTAEASPPAAAFCRIVGAQGASADITATATGLASSSLDFTTLGLTAGQWILIGGDAAGTHFATAACNGWARMESITAHAITCDIVPAGMTTDAGTGKTIQIFFGDFMINGTTQQSFTFERQQQDLPSPVYEYFPGCQVDKFTLPFKASSVLTGTISMVGQGSPTQNPPTTTRFAGATDLSAPTYSILNASSHIGELYENGAAVTSFITEIDLDIANNLSAQFAVGNIGAIGVLNGEFNVSGSLVAYFSNLTLLLQCINDTDTSMMFRVGRTDGNRESLQFDVPSMRVSATSPVDAKNQSRMLNGTFAAKIHPVLQYMLSVSRFWYLPIAS